MTKKLRKGYTTGSCAAAAAGGAARMLLSQQMQEEVGIRTPGGVPLRLELTDPHFTQTYARCAVRKDSGDDPDITNGILVYACVKKLPGVDLHIMGGEGIGRITKPGLACPVGEWAINPGPRRMILEALESARREAGYDGGLAVELSIPGGEALAVRTFNPRLGILGGLSILGTTGIVEPMSEQALTETIRLELHVLREAGYCAACLVPGSYGEEFARESFGVPPHLLVKCSNFIGEAIDSAAEEGFREILLIGHLGKLIKLAAGVFNTHSRYGDGRAEIMTAHAALAGCGGEIARRLMDAVTTEEAVSVLREAGLDAAVMHSLKNALETHLKRRAGDMRIGAAVFTKRHGLLFLTQDAGGQIEKMGVKKEGLV